MAVIERDRFRYGQFPHPVSFWLGVAASVAGVALHLPMYFGARDMGYHLAHMQPDLPMILGMVLIVAGLIAALYGLIPPGSEELRRHAAAIKIRALDDAPIRFQHVALLLVMALAVTIDVMKPTTLAFVAPGVAKEYGLQTASNPHGSVPVTWLPLAGIVGTVVGSLLWGWAGDRIGRRSTILFAGILFISTSICGVMPGFVWNLMMCFIMGIGAGGMLPIAFALIAETIPARHRGWLMVLIGGDIAGAYVITSWLAASLMPTFSWRIMWLVGMPTGVLLILLNRWIPESPRYLLATGRQRDAEAVMRRYGAAIVDDGRAEPATAQETRTQWRFADLVRKPFLGQTVAVAGVAISVGLLTFGFQFWVPTNMQRMGFSEMGSNYMLRNSALLGLPLIVLIALLYGFWSSKKTVILLCTLTASAVLMFAVFGDSLAHNKTLLSVLLVIPLGGISSITAVIVVYGPEIYPTRIRSRGTGLVAGLTKVGGVLVLAIILAATPTPSLATTALIGAVPLLLAILVFAYTTPETKQRTLEDITQDELVTDSAATSR